MELKTSRMQSQRFVADLQYICEFYFILWLSGIEGSGWDRVENRMWEGVEQGLI